MNFYSYRERRIKKIPLWIDNEEIKYIHDIYETEDSELWLASVGMGIVRARIGGTPDHPVLENMQRYVANAGEFGSNCFFTKETAWGYYSAIWGLEYFVSMKSVMDWSR